MAPQPEPVFNTFRRRLYRPFFSLIEFWMGLVCLAVLAVVLVWVLHRGRNPDPTLFHTDDKLLATKGTEAAVYKRPVDPWREPGSAALPAPSLAPFPNEIVGDGWTASAPVSEFDEANLYIKIDGREGFYKSFGFQRLSFVSLVNDKLSIDIELFDQGSIENALGTMGAEITKPDVEFAAEPAGFSYTSANAAFLVHGRYYARLIGSDDDEAIRKKLAALMAALIAKLPGGKVPWAYALLTGGLHVSPAKLVYYPTDAFSFDFATEVYTAKVNGDMEVFVSRRGNEAEAKALAGKFVEAFGSYGKPVPATDATMLRNEYIGTIDGVSSQGEYVIGVRLAPNVDEAQKWLKTLRGVLPSATISDGSGHGE
jgi:hypothetical protein